MSREFVSFRNTDFCSLYDTRPPYSHGSNSSFSHSDPPLPYLSTFHILSLRLRLLIHLATPSLPTDSFSLLNLPVMAWLLVRFTALLVNIVPACAFLFGRNRALPPSSNIHVDIANHVHSALDTHTADFHHSWRDYLLVLLLLVLCGVFISRRLTAAFVRRRPPQPQDSSQHSTTAAKY
jgi:hypothetical protein